MKHAAISTIKKLLFGLIFLLTACRPATPTPAASFFPTATLPPTPIPASVTPQPPASQTPAFTATPFPRFFTDEFDDSLAGWAILQAGNDAAPNIKTGTSNLLLQMDSPYTWVYGLYGAQDYDSVRVETQFINQAGTPASIGLICHYSESAGWFEYNVSTDGTYNLLRGKWLTNGIADYLPITSGASTEIQPSGAAQEIGLICSGTTLSLLIGPNMVRSVDVSRYELAEGKVGIAAASFENAPVVAAFNWVKVSEP